LDYYVPIRDGSLEHPAPEVSTFHIEVLPLFSSSRHFFVFA
jgi:hypothetical protein